MSTITPSPYPTADDPTIAEPSRIVATRPVADATLPDSVPDIERFRIVEELGRGGMGLVYRAEQLAPVRRMVALKVIEPGRKSQLDDRFRAESQTLAKMRHPYIATMYEAGETADGQPYFVMELVEGLPITAYCDHHRLSLGDRLALFASVCDGIQHAHEHGVIHRDIKPSNILVTGPPRRPIPKIIDFGVAKHLDANKNLTRVGHVVGSPSHMSPEQMDAGSRAIDTRSDVYALGTVLFELLTDTSLFISASGSVFDYLMLIAAQKMEKPSERCAVLGDKLAKVAHERGTTPRRLKQALRGDLDYIVAKAVARDREDRYPSAFALASDVRCHLEGQPVVAHPGGQLYILRKLVSRNRAASIFALLLATAVVVALWLILASLGRARASERQARAAAQQAQTVNRFLTDLLSSADPARGGRDARVLDLIETHAETVDAYLSDEPLIEASVRHTLGMTYFGLGLYPDAEAQLTRAFELRRDNLRPSADETMESRLALIELALHGEQLEATETGARALLEDIRAQRDADAPLTLRARFLVASAAYLRGHYDKAATQLAPLLEDQERVHGRNHPETLESLLLLAKTHHRQNALDTAEALYRKVHDARTLRFGSEHPRSLESANLLANALFSQERFADAEVIYRETLARREARLGTEHPETLSSLNNLANTLYKQGLYAEAETLYRQVSDTQRRLLGEDHPDTLISMNNLANTLRRQERSTEAEALYRDTMDRQRRVLGPAHDETIRTTLNLIKLLVLGGHVDDAVALLDRARTERPDVVDFEDWRMSLAQDRGDWATALAAARAILKHMPDQLEIRAEEGRYLLLLGQPGDARLAYRRARTLAPSPEALERAVIAPLAVTVADHPELTGAAEILAWLQAPER